jgi:NADH-quinone oxidoreductase subunit G
VVDVERVDAAPIIDLRVRKAARRGGARVITLTSRPSSLDPAAAAAVRFAPEAAEAALGALLDPSDDLAGRAGADVAALRAAAEVLEGAGSVVLIWGEHISRGERGRQTIAALLAAARQFDAKLIEIPAGANGRGLREVGCAPGLGPGLGDADPPPEEAGGPAALVLLNAEPSATLLEQAESVIAFASFRGRELYEHADVVFPAESYAEKEGTVTHPDGRIQRVRQAIGRPNEVRAGWWVLGELCERLGAALPADSAPLVTAELTKAAGIYEGITLDEIGGTGVRWQERDAAAKLPGAELPEGELETPPELPEGMRLGAAPSLWEGHVTRHAPALRFLTPHPRAELAPADAERLGVRPGDEVLLSSNGTSVRAAAALRSGVQPGSVFLVGANGLPRSIEVRKA